jgi:hypothetical protein
MGKKFNFWWTCIKLAALGNSASANDWQWVFANPIWQSIGGMVGAGLGAFASRYWRGAPMMSPDTPIGIFLGGLFGFAFTWLILFIMRLIREPAKLYHEQKDRADAAQQQLDLLHALEIIFDPANPGRRFWSIEQMRNEAGEQIARTFWEYRAVIKNKSVMTVRNTKVTVEAIGDLPTRPELSQFDINKRPLIDLTPGEWELAVICRWFNPPIVEGMVIGESAYGPIKMTASADDVLPAIKVFQFDPMKTPMIFELDTDDGYKRV